MKKHDFIAVLDFGAQYAMLIARRVRECNVYCEILPHNISVAELKKRKIKGIIISGGPSSVYEKDAPKADPHLFKSGIPILGICYGTQLIARELGGSVKPGKKKEYGRTELFIDDKSNIFAGFVDHIICWMSHGDSVAKLPKGFKVLAHTANTPIAALGDVERKIYGVQFHPEVVHTERGNEILKNFVYVVCGAKPTWTTENFVEEQLKEIKATVGKEKILLALSGGVDSSTVAALISKAVGKQLTCMFIDQGFMRKNEAKKINEIFTKRFKLNFIHIDSSARFFAKLKGITDPEEKRHRIGNEFIRVFEEEAKKLGKIHFLAQGTLYPDVIESAVPGLTATTAVRIKTHHNVGGLPKDIKFKLVEPLRKLFKDEVRALGRELGVPEDIITRQPFPGPGLAIRIIGEVTPERVKILQNVDDIVVSEVKKAGLYKELWQSFAVLLPIRTVGVMGDKRTYLNTVAIRAVSSRDAMTADWAKLPYELLDIFSNRIINEVPEINRVVYDISSKPPATIEWE
ncbi:glutamine-hydrolyzing GMP synthase [candidate division WOR-1 bacterium RIFCSPHIGHO2_01_FULL_53_15]|uniref:GMP synthase [glutamine-hydrolyzing] n=1 Tax=candidate division WOR-1 bacterium RIFCSPHIGHO2_01_FULL_53_15 TaxID=1802564 RepID=A0A1F4Q4G5_UNCSA|nr:MAG: glutamine-hydrolyzing GMP synthase [candidate division WOR-1 bacterium RIFCSPHIGHO2_01_FULL_53_15]OGC13938.1 MAG: glutamine-hydrolyzing GMP synthase [candidate division WOR-1 bacterium RIFCSPHIGHO2_02_FULL_53_26]